MALWVRRMVYSCGQSPNTVLSIMDRVYAEHWSMAVMVLSMTMSPQSTIRFGGVVRMVG